MMVVHSTSTRGCSATTTAPVRANWQGHPGDVVQNADTTATVDVDLTALDCGLTDLSRVKAMWVRFSKGGVFHLDHVWVK